MESGSEQEKEKDAARCLHKGAVSNGVDCFRAHHTEDLVIVPTLFAIHPLLLSPPRPSPPPFPVSLSTQELRKLASRIRGNQRHREETEFSQSRSSVQLLESCKIYGERLRDAVGEWCRTPEGMRIVGSPARSSARQKPYTLSTAASDHTFIHTWME